MDISALKKVFDQQSVCVESDGFEEEACRWDGEQAVDVSEYVEMDGTFVRITNTEQPFKYFELIKMEPSLELIKIEPSFNKPIEEFLSTKPKTIYDELIDVAKFFSDK